MPAKSPPPSEELIEQLADYNLSVGELSLALRQMVLEEAPAALETVFRSYALVFWYSFTGRMSDSFCYVALNSRHVNLGFYRGAQLQDPDGVLEGDGKQMRHIKVKRPEDLKRPQLRRLIRAAIKHSKSLAKEKAAHSSVKPTKRRPATRRSSK